MLHQYTGEGFDFHLPEAALKEKGFTIVRVSAAVHVRIQLIRTVDCASECGGHGRCSEPRWPGWCKMFVPEIHDERSQFWLISTDHPQLTPDHIRIIKDFFEKSVHCIVLARL